jgi:phenylalanyl-tRNA synthetase alpha chain
MLEQIEQAEQQALAELHTIQNLDALRAWRNAHLGKTGTIGAISRGMGQVSADERPRVGQRINAAKQALQAAYDALEVQLEEAARAAELEGDRVDVTLPGRPINAGRLHVNTQTQREVERVFGQMGFSVWESREVEWDELNFGLLNFPPDHPARDEQDSFFIKTPPDAPKAVLRTHTSPGQIHAMRRFAPEPVRVLLPGKCYRNDEIDARHNIQFTQFEFLAVGRSITMGDLKGTLDALASGIFGADTHTRLRPSYFPFTEPSAELDVTCIVCRGGGCRVCSYTGWVELGGCGMVHPNVLRNGGYDPDEYSGFAGGFGIERIAQMKYGIDEARVYTSGDLRFLEQF